MRYVIRKDGEMSTLGVHRNTCENRTIDEAEVATLLPQARRTPPPRRDCAVERSGRRAITTCLDKLNYGDREMKKAFVIAMAAGLVSLSACNSSQREQAADNIESNTEAVADNLEDAADNVSNDAAEASLENKADAVRATGQNQADDMRTNDPDTNLSNGI